MPEKRKLFGTAFTFTKKLNPHEKVARTGRVYINLQDYNTQIPPDFSEEGRKLATLLELIFPAETLVQTLKRLIDVLSRSVYLSRPV